MASIDRVIILGQSIAVTETDPEDWAENGMGRCSQIKARITLRKDMPDDARLSTLLHEVTHLIADMNGLDKLASDEIQVSVIANNWLAFLRQNPAVMQWISDNAHAKD
jgi:hypothetical protein